MHLVVSLLTVGDVATILALSRRTIYKRDWQRRAGLGPVRIGRSLRFRRADVTRFLRREAAVADDASLRQREIDSLRRWARRHGLED